EHAKGATAAALHRPEQVGVVAGIQHEHSAICRHDFGLQQTGRAQSVLLGEAAKPATVNEPCDTYGRAAAALHIPSASCRPRSKAGKPPSPGLYGDRRLWSMRGVAANRNESIVQRDATHLARPDQQ